MLHIVEVNQAGDVYYIENIEGDLLNSVLSNNDSLEVYVNH
jgi:hypothetical protein